MFCYLRKFERSRLNGCKVKVSSMLRHLHGMLAFSICGFKDLPN